MGILDTLRTIGTGMTQGSPIGWGLDVANALQHQGGGGHPAAAAPPQQRPSGPGQNPISHIVGDQRNARQMLMDAFQKYGVDPANPYSNVQGLAKMRAEDPFWYNQAVSGSPIGNQPGSGGGFVNDQTFQAMQGSQAFQQNLKPLLDPKAMGELLNQVMGSISQGEKTTQDAIKGVKGASPNVTASALGATGTGADFAKTQPAFQVLIDAINQQNKQTQAAQSLFGSAGGSDILRNLLPGAGTGSTGTTNLPPLNTGR